MSAETPAQTQTPIVVEGQHTTLPTPLEISQKGKDLSSSHAELTGQGDEDLYNKSLRLAVAGRGLILADVQDPRLGIEPGSFSDRVEHRINMSVPDGPKIWTEARQGYGGTSWNVKSPGDIMTPGQRNSTESVLRQSESAIDAHNLLMQDIIVHNQTELLGQACDLLGAEFHDQWRADRALESPDNAGNKFEPREKPTNDESWIAKNGTNTVDIANTDYEDLPVDWKKENQDAGNIVVGIIVDAGGKIDLSDPETYSRVGSQIHEAWLSRENNSYARGGELDVPFDELPDDEQAKDMQQMQTAIDTFQL